MFFTSEGTTFLLSRETEESIAKRSAQKENSSNPSARDNSERDMEYYAVKLNFVNAKPDPEVIG